MDDNELEKTFVERSPGSFVPSAFAKDGGGSGILLPNSRPIIGQTRFGSSVVTEIIGEGGMATVYKVWNERLEVFRAVKLLSQEAFSARFETEAKITAKLRHEGIVEIHNIGEWNGLPYMEMEFVDGFDLQQTLTERGKLPEIVCVAIATSVAEALAYAHIKTFTLVGKQYCGIIHRDLKPANIMISKYGAVKLTDFGIARPTQASLHTIEGNITGTMQYLSPEQMDGGEVDNRSDIYSFGTILYEMVTGAKTFPQGSITELMKQKSVNKFKSPNEYGIPVNADLVKIILRCLRLTPDKRYQRTQDLVNDLQRLNESLTKLTPRGVLKNYLDGIEDVVSADLGKTKTRWILSKLKALGASDKPKAAELPVGRGLSGVSDEVEVEELAEEPKTAGEPVKQETSGVSGESGAGELPKEPETPEVPVKQEPSVASDKTEAVELAKEPKTPEVVPVEQRPSGTPDKPKTTKPAEESKTVKPVEKPKPEKPADKPKPIKPVEKPKTVKPAEKPKPAEPAAKPKPIKPAEKPKTVKLAGESTISISTKSWRTILIVSLLLLTVLSLSYITIRAITAKPSATKPLAAKTTVNAAASDSAAARVTKSISGDTTTAAQKTALDAWRASISASVTSDSTTTFDSTAAAAAAVAKSISDDSTTAKVAKLTPNDTTVSAPKTESDTATSPKAPSVLTVTTPPATPPTPAAVPPSKSAVTPPTPAAVPPSKPAVTPPAPATARPTKSAVTPPSDFKSENEQLHYAIVASNAKLWDMAIEILEQDGVYKEKNAQRMLYLLNAYVESRQFGKAQTIIDTTSLTQDAYFLLCVGKFWYYRKSFDKAIGHFETSLSHTSIVERESVPPEAALYFIADIKHERFKATPSAFNKSSALEAWRKVSAALASKPNDPRAKRAEQEISALNAR